VVVGSQAALEWAVIDLWAEIGLWGAGLKVRVEARGKDWTQVEKEWWWLQGTRVGKMMTLAMHSALSRL
jgi:hypothetical protein